MDDQPTERGQRLSRAAAQRLSLYLRCVAVWPGDGEKIIFVLLVFVLAQAFLSVALTGRDRALDKLNRQVAELSDMLSLERSRVGELQLSSASLGRDLQAANAARDQLTRDVAGLRAEGAKAQTERDTLKSERDRLTARLADAELQAQSALARNTQLQARIAETAGRTDAAGQETAAVVGQLADIRRQLAQARAERAAVQADLDSTVKADRATIEARVGDIARLNAQLTTLTALRDELEKQVKDAAVRATTDEQRRQALAVQLAEAGKLGDSARAQVALLNQQMAALREQMQQVATALNIAEAAGRDDKAQIANLSTRLNTALASKVEELQRYRSEFFGKLRDVLQNRQDVQVVGDRFVFQSEVLFPAGSAEMSASGQEQITKLAATLKQIAAEIPPDVNWLLRVDGHADKQPRRSGDSGNWELSAQRAINVVKLLVDDGIPANRLAATGFGEYQPLDPGDTAAAFARNRRIELRLTDR